MTWNPTSAPSPHVGGQTAAGLGRDRVENRPIRGAFRRAKATFDEGESLWIPAMILAIGYGIVIPVFLLIVALDYTASYLAGGH